MAKTEGSKKDIEVNDDVVESDVPSKTPAEFPASYEEFVSVSKERKTLLAGFRASLSGDLHPRLRAEWSKLLEAYKKKEIK